MTLDLGMHQFSLADQNLFAELSGDFNPMHVDPVSARRELFGQVVVHGVHAVLRALEFLFCRQRRSRGENIELESLRVSFPAPMFLGCPMRVVQADEQPGAARIEVLDGMQPCVTIDVRWRAPATTYPTPRGDRREPVEPSVLEVGELVGYAGELDLSVPPGPLVELLPELADILPPVQIAEILALTRLVGMVCPGLRSVFSRFDITFPAAGDDNGERMRFVVRSLKERLRLVKMDVSGPSARGTVEALVRPAPMQQPALANIRQLVAPGEFQGQCALVIGGSRGLGEVTAKIIAAGGGLPLLTYHRGADDATRLAAEMRALGADVEVMAWDVASADAAAENLKHSGRQPTHVYYFASPRIMKKSRVQFSNELFRSFSDVYVDGLLATYQACRTLSAELLTFFYPSTVFLDGRRQEFVEYAAAKAAGEVLCGHLDEVDNAARFRIERLPRMATDQTNSLLRVRVEEPVQIMLDVVRNVHTAHFA
jgi:hypothetical protein